MSRRELISELIVVALVSVACVGFGYWQLTKPVPVTKPIVVPQHSMITVTPLDSPNPCWTPDYWSHTV